MPLPSIIDEQNVAAIIRDKNAILQPEGPRIPGDPRYENRPTNATPAVMKVLLDELLAYTQEVQEAAKRHGMDKDTVQAQWQSDMAHFVSRLNRYQEEIKAVDLTHAHTLQGADQIYFTVTSPLLDGYFYRSPAPGIMLTQEEKDRMAQGGASNKKPPDLYVPFSLGNQVLVYRDQQEQRWDAFWQDVWEGAKDLLGKARDAVPEVASLFPPWVVGVGIAVGVTALAFGVGYAFMQYRRAATLFNPQLSR